MPSGATVVVANFPSVHLIQLEKGLLEETLTGCRGCSCGNGCSWRLSPSILILIMVLVHDLLSWSICPRVHRRSIAVGVIRRVMVAIVVLMRRRCGVGLLNWEFSLGLVFVLEKRHCCLCLSSVDD